MTEGEKLCPRCLERARRSGPYCSPCKNVYERERRSQPVVRDRIRIRGSRLARATRDAERIAIPLHLRVQLAELARERGIVR